MKRWVPAFFCLLLPLLAVSVQARPHYTSMDRIYHVNWGGAQSRGEIKAVGLPAVQDLKPLASEKLRSPRLREGRLKPREGRVKPREGRLKPREGRLKPREGRLRPGIREERLRPGVRERRLRPREGRMGRRALKSQPSAKSAARRMHKPIRLTKRVDAATPMIRGAFKNKRRLPRVVLSARNSAGKHYQIVLRNARITHYSVNGTGKTATEQITLVYESAQRTGN